MSSLGKVLPVHEVLFTAPDDEEARLCTDSSRVRLNTLFPETRNKAKSMWRRAFFKIKARRALARVNEELLLYGTTNELTDANCQYKTNIDEVISKKEMKQEKFREAVLDEEKEVSRWLIRPSSPFKVCWNVIVSFLLAYAAIVMPWRIAFSDSVFWDMWTISDFCIDFLFFIDVIINFLSVRVNRDGTIESNPKVIAMAYLKSWFVVDFISCLPFSLLDMLGSDSSTNNSRYNNLLRLARLPRLYKLFRIARVIKAFDHYHSEGILDRIQDFFQINSRLLKLLKFLLTASICIHLSACVWYFSARISDLDPDTWVVRCGFANEDSWTIYLAAVYWSITTCVTVGYGDINAYTQLEMVIAIAWMVIGVGFYSFTIGSLSSFLTSIDTRESVLASKMAAIHEFAKETGISREAKSQIRDAVRYTTYKLGNVWSDKHSLFRELPKQLQYEVAMSMFGGIAKNFPFFMNKDAAFVVYVMPLFKPLRLRDSEVLYREGEYADEVFFILQGRVNFVLPRTEVVYKSFLRGSYIGEVEVLQETTRRNTALCFGDCEFLVLHRRDLKDIIYEFPAEGRSMKAIARERARRNKQAYYETAELLRLKRALGNVQSLAGQNRLFVLKTEEETEVATIEDFYDRLKKTEAELQTTRVTVTALTKAIEDLRKSVTEDSQSAKAFNR